MQLQLAERIADAVAARLNRHTAQSLAERPEHDASGAQTCCDAAPTHMAPQAAGIACESTLQPSTDNHADAAVELSLHSLERDGSLRQPCKEEGKAALRQGSPVRPSCTGQASSQQACEQDFLAALLLGSPGNSGHVSHSASPGLMHKEGCSNTSSEAAEVAPVSNSRVQPWTAQWAGKLTQQQMEMAVQEVWLPQALCLPDKPAVHEIVYIVYLSAVAGVKASNLSQPWAGTHMSGEAMKPGCMQCMQAISDGSALSMFQYSAWSCVDCR